MGTITMTIDAGTAGTATKTFTVTNTNLGRLADFAKTMGSPEMTNQQALERWMRWVMDMTKDHIMARERQTMAVPDFEASAP